MLDNMGCLINRGGHQGGGGCCVVVFTSMVNIYGHVVMVS